MESETINNDTRAAKKSRARQPGWSILWICAVVRVGMKVWFRIFLLHRGDGFEVHPYFVLYCFTSLHPMAVETMKYENVQAAGWGVRKSAWYVFRMCENVVLYIGYVIFSFLVALRRMTLKFILTFSYTAWTLYFVIAGGMMDYDSAVLQGAEWPNFHDAQWWVEDDIVGMRYLLVCFFLLQWPFMFGIGLKCYFLRDFISMLWR